MASQISCPLTDLYKVLRMLERGGEGIGMVVCFIWFLVI